MAVRRSSKTRARPKGLRYVNDGEPGIHRRRAGRGFAYRDARGRAVRATATLQRIRALAIPPAYTDVWICADARGHIQATGRDARGRKQYRYHAQWRQQRDEGKFDRVLAFGRALPALRRRVRRDLRLPGYPRDKVLAMVVAVMAETLLRIGNGEYARSNRSFGLTTLRNRHVAFLRGGRALLSFRGKGGQAQQAELNDARLVRMMRGVQQLPGQALFQYRDDEGKVQPVDSGAVNAYLREAMGAEFTAKDFRTWGATLAAFKRLAATPLPVPGRNGAISERAWASAETEVVGEVAQFLRNTVTVCRKAYIDPQVFAGWRDGRLARCADGARSEAQWERAALKFLRASRRSAAR
ncbi:DNA topoisomerase IB [Lysobacter silvisoli]|uniref:DNA topoisomerase n=1 Tax=Lysobacter silvisoli TaxID=2293254 RepID=A0A371K046_9GAMM|nr:DNA topoisomerase IB [Lysobacter silvisoli]RDZ27293.1 DNA topoisomerase IB [Lysobacter silvisoli]